jgi:hypothetical protein
VTTVQRMSKLQTGWRRTKVEGGVPIFGGGLLVLCCLGGTALTVLLSQEYP